MGQYSLTDSKYLGRQLKFPSPRELESLVAEYFQDWAKKDRKDPYTLSGLALHLGVISETLIDYQARPAYSHILKRAREMIMEDVCKRAIRGRINPVFAIFYLKNTFGWTDRHESVTNVNISLVDQLKSALKNVKVDGSQSRYDTTPTKLVSQNKHA